VSFEQFSRFWARGKPHAIPNTQLAEHQTPSTWRIVLAHRDYLRKQSFFRYFSALFAGLSCNTCLTPASIATNPAVRQRSTPAVD